MKDATVYIGDPASDAVVVEGDLFVMDSQRVQCGGVEVVAVGWFFCCARAERIGGKKVRFPPLLSFVRAGFHGAH
ncbi:MAG: hypothetical protein RIS92_3257 [Verrucomicrobiota bacterium]